MSTTSFPTKLEGSPRIVHACSSARMPTTEKKQEKYNHDVKSEVWGGWIENDDDDSFEIV